LLESIILMLANAVKPRGGRAMTGRATMSTNRLAGALSVISVLVWSGAADGQTRAEARLSKAKSLKCVFSLMATGSWKNGEPQAEAKSAKLSIGFDAIDVEEGTARVIGMFGPSDIIVKLSLGTLHFVQSFREGPVYVTTIFPKETRNGSLQAVHTRHEYTEVSLPGFTSQPEQYYGECAVDP